MARRRNREEILDLYITRAEQTVDRRFVQSGGLNVSIQITFERDKGAELTVSPIDEEDFRSFLMDLRHFLAPGEDVFVDKVYELLDQAADEPLRARLAAARARWENAGKSGVMPLVINSQTVSPLKLLNQVINGRYFHSDKAKREALDALSGFAEPFTQQLLFLYLGETLGYVVDLARAILEMRERGLALITGLEASDGGARDSALPVSMANDETASAEAGLRTATTALRHVV